MGQSSSQPKPQVSSQSHGVLPQRIISEEESVKRYLRNNKLLSDEETLVKTLRKLHQQAQKMVEEYVEKFDIFFLDSKFYCQRKLRNLGKLSKEALQSCQLDIADKFGDQLRPKIGQIWENTLTHEEKWLDECLEKKASSNGKMYSSLQEMEKDQYGDQCVKETKEKILKEVFRQNNEIFRRIIDEDMK